MQYRLIKERLSRQQTKFVGSNPNRLNLSVVPFIDVGYTSLVDVSIFSIIIDFQKVYLAPGFMSE